MQPYGCNTPKALHIFLCSFLKVQYDLLWFALLMAMNPFMVFPKLKAARPKSKVQAFGIHLSNLFQPRHRQGPGLPVLDSTNMNEDVWICPHLETESSNMFKTKLHNERRTDKCTFFQIGSQTSAAGSQYGETPKMSDLKILSQSTLTYRHYKSIRESCSLRLLSTW